MANGHDKEEVHRRSMHAEREELQQATQRFIRGMFHTGVSLALLPINTLPPKPRQHLQSAGRELTYGLASLVHEFANGLEEIAKDANTSTNVGEVSHPYGEQE